MGGTGFSECGSTNSCEEESVSVVDKYLQFAEEKIGKTEDQFLSKLRNEALVVVGVSALILWGLAKRK